RTGEASLRSSRSLREDPGDRQRAAESYKGAGHAESVGALGGGAPDGSAGERRSELTGRGRRAARRLGPGRPLADGSRGGAGGAEAIRKGERCARTCPSASAPSRLCVIPS